MIKAKYLVLYLAKTKTKHGLDAYLIDNNRLLHLCYRPMFLSHTHILGYNLTFQKPVSDFKTHQTSPATKNIDV